jgi:hypothetical protein
MEVRSLTGQSVPFESEEIDYQTTSVHLVQPPGMYLVRCSRGAATKTYKLILNR